MIQRKQKSSTHYVPIVHGLVPDTYYRDTSVYEGTSYQYRVAAENEAGQGAFSKPLGPVDAKQPFGELEISMGFFKCNKLTRTSIKPQNTSILGMENAHLHILHILDAFIIPTHSSCDRDYDPFKHFVVTIETQVTGSSLNIE